MNLYYFLTHTVPVREGQVSLGLLQKNIATLQAEVIEVEERITVLARMKEALDLPLPTPRDPRRMRVGWFLVGVAAGMIVAAIIIIVGGWLS